MSAWSVLGKYYGFPKCCVEAFEIGNHISEDKPRQLSGTGYIPCHHCNTTKTEDVLVAAINLNRFEPKPFPCETDYNESVQYILSSNQFSAEEKALIQDQLDYNLECDAVYAVLLNDESEDEFNYSQQIAYLALELDIIADVVQDFKSKAAYNRVYDKIEQFLKGDMDLQSFQEFNKSVKKEFKVTRKVNEIMEEYKSSEAISYPS